jgi:hypothetical protein
MIGLILVLVVVGVILNFIEMDAKVRQILYAVLVIAVVVVLLDLLGIYHVPIGNLHGR